MNSKHALGQYMTTNQHYILQNLYIPENTTHIIEPFAGNCDLLEFIQNPTQLTIELYDIAPPPTTTTTLANTRTTTIQQQDTITFPPSYTNKFVLTNPPYLARNKSINKALFDKYGTNDLYKCFLSEIMSNTNHPTGGIIIIPLNFWSSIRKADIQIRKQFLEKYTIIHLNIFEEQVFSDTTTTVCSFQFELRNQTQQQQQQQQQQQVSPISISIYPSQLQMTVSLTPDNNYTIGGEIYMLPRPNPSVYSITRITRKKYSTNGLTNILGKCIDDSADSTIELRMVEDADIYVDETPNQSARTYATLVIVPAISKKRQAQLVLDFNHLLDAYREKYHSLFLTNYRESKDIARKRISFDLIYQIVGHLLG